VNSFNTGEDDRPTLLLADDDVVTLSTLDAQLSASFRVVGVAQNGTDAATLAGEHHPDLALVDVQMPGGGARVAVPQILRSSPGTVIFILSGDESRESVLELLTAGASGYLRKGVSSTEITQSLLGALRVHSS
jgi:DNA-binding NarL/FixJ family response regulator